MPRRNISSDKQSTDQSVYPIVQSDIPGNSTDKDVRHKRTRGIGAKKYLRESCYNRIECSVANSLAVLMRKGYLNSVFQPYNYPQRLLEDADGIRINPSNLPSRWRIKMKREK